MKSTHENYLSFDISFLGFKLNKFFFSTQCTIIFFHHFNIIIMKLHNSSFSSWFPMALIVIQKNKIKIIYTMNLEEIYTKQEFIHKIYAGGKSMNPIFEVISMNFLLKKLWSICHLYSIYTNLSKSTYRDNLRSRIIFPTSTLTSIRKKWKSLALKVCSDG
jgi:hypothetical protein